MVKWRNGRTGRGWRFLSFVRSCVHPMDGPFVDSPIDRFSIDSCSIDSLLLGCKEAPPGLKMVKR